MYIDNMLFVIFDRISWYRSKFYEQIILYHFPSQQSNEVQVFYSVSLLCIVYRYLIHIKVKNVFQLNRSTFAVKILKAKYLHITQNTMNIALFCFQITLHPM